MENYKYSFTEEEMSAIETMKHWIDFEKKNKSKINKAEELINIQEIILNIIEKQYNIINNINKNIK